MAAPASEIIGKLMDELKTVARTETILGQEIKVGEFTLIPVSRISLGSARAAAKARITRKKGRAAAEAAG